VDLSSNRIIELIISNALTDEQFEGLAARPEVQHPPVDKVYARHELFNAIDKLGLAETFERIKQTHDASVHQHIMDHPDLAGEHVVWLAINGLNKRIRNIARQLSNSRKFR
jgi:hypothetical protein